MSLKNSFGLEVVGPLIHASTADLGRQTQIHGKKVPVHEMCAKIDAVQLEVSRFAQMYHR